MKHSLENSLENFTIDACLYFEEKYKMINAEKIPDLEKYFDKFDRDAETNKPSNLYIANRRKMEMMKKKAIIY